MDFTAKCVFCLPKTEWLKRAVLHWRIHCKNVFLVLKFVEDFYINANSLHVWKSMEFLFYFAQLYASRLLAFVEWRFVSCLSVHVLTIKYHHFNLCRMKLCVFSFRTYHHWRDQSSFFYPFVRVCPQIIRFFEQRSAQLVLTGYKIQLKIQN